MDKHGNVVGTMGISRDITERKRIEQELHKYRVRLEELVSERTAELQQANEELEQDIARAKARRGKPGGEGARASQIQYDPRKPLAD